MAARHAKDQTDYWNSYTGNKGDNLFPPNCNLHSWKTEQPCCYDPNNLWGDSGTANCMHHAHKRLLPSDYSIDSLFEVNKDLFTFLKKASALLDFQDSLGPRIYDGSYMNPDDKADIKSAIDAWLKSTGGHRDQILGINGWYKPFAGCGSIGRFVHCVFSD